VSKINLEDGTIITNFIEIKNVSNSHFVELYTQNNNANKDNIDSMQEHIPSMILNEENLELTQPITENEIHIAIWSLEPDKDP
jgi:hypothetical protein